MVVGNTSANEKPGATGEVTDRFLYSFAYRLTRASRSVSSRMQASRGKR